MRRRILRWRLPGSINLKDGKKCCVSLKLPKTMKFILSDKVVALEPGSQIRAVKNVSLDEE